MGAFLEGASVFILNLGWKFSGWTWANHSFGSSRDIPVTGKYDVDGTNTQKTETDYNLTSTYLSRRIIGLPSEVRTYGLESTGLNLMSKVTLAYDEGDFSDSGLSQNISPVQHDGTNYGAAFVAGRGNLTSSTKHDVLGVSSAITSSVKYNTAGSIVSQTDPMSRTVKIGYGDNFNSSPGVSTFAYVTSMADPANNTSTVKYRYDTGANVEATSPAPAGNTYGKTTKRIYDSIGRLQRDSVYVNTTEHAYTRYEYPTNGVHSKVFATLVDMDNDGADADDEVLSEGWTDGAGRVRFTRTPHTFSGGSTASWAGTITEYDILGQVKRQSVPTEVDNSWNATGDDAARGFLWTHQKYDWMGRVTRKINTDGVDSPTVNDSDILISYEGCGCAGGLVTTIQSELVPRGTSMTARRKQKIYADIQGRDWKTVVYEWDGTTVYTTTEKTYNGRDQVVKVRQTDNSSTSTPKPYQDVTMTYDGFGRMKTRHYPIEDALTDTTWNYNADSSINQIIDPRGVVTDYSYNSRGLTSQIAYTPVGTIPDTPTVTFSYDDLGNRTSMQTAGVSEITYAYDPLSRMTSETVDFDDLTNDLTINYTYGLTNLRSVTDPFGSEIEYANDKAGRLTAVTGDPFAQNTTGNYASGIQYRAFGQVKQMNYNLPVGDANIKMEYDNRLKVNYSHATEAGSSSSYLLRADLYIWPTDGSRQRTTFSTTLGIEPMHTTLQAG